MRIGEIIVQNRLPIPSPTRIASKRGASPKGEARRESAAKEERSDRRGGRITWWGWVGGWICTKTNPLARQEEPAHQDELSPNSPYSGNASALFTIRGVRKINSSFLSSRKRRRLNKTPRTGMSPKNGTWSTLRPVFRV